MVEDKKSIGVDFLRQKIKNISQKAGVYRMIDKDGVVLYAGIFGVLRIYVQSGVHYGQSI